MSEVYEYKPSMLRGLWALTKREVKKWLKDPVTLFMVILQPVIWMVLLGKAMNLGALFSAGPLNNLKIPDMQLPGYLANPPVSGTIRIPGDLISRWIQELLPNLGSEMMKNAFGVTDYFSYMAIGMISMVVVSTTMFSAVSIVWDRRLGFLDKVLSTPVPRGVIVLSKVLNSTIRSLFQATVILAIAMALGLHLSPDFTLLNLLGFYASICLLGIGLSSVFLAFSLRSTRMERPMQLISLIMLPLMFASNVFFPIPLMPNWLQAIAKVNPITYLTDAIRQFTILPMNPAELVLDLVYLGLFAVISTVVGTILSWRYLSV